MAAERRCLHVGLGLQGACGGRRCSSICPATGHRQPRPQHIHMQVLRVPTLVAGSSAAASASEAPPFGRPRSQLQQRRGAACSPAKAHPSAAAEAPVAAAEPDPGGAEHWAIVEVGGCVDRWADREPRSGRRTLPARQESKCTYVSAPTPPGGSLCVGGRALCARPAYNPACIRRPPARACFVCIHTSRRSAT